jgi:hypothetical protein
VPWAKQVSTTEEGERFKPTKCKLCDAEENLRRFVEDSYEEGMSALAIMKLIVKDPYKFKVSRNLISNHCKHHKFLRHEAEAEAARIGIDIENAKTFQKFMDQKSIFWHGTFVVPPELLEETFDPLKRMQELFMIQYSRFIKMVNREHKDEIILKETKQLGAELRELINSLFKMTGDASNKPEIKEAAVTMMLIKALDTLPLSGRAELIKILSQSEKIEDLK